MAPISAESHYKTRLQSTETSQSTVLRDPQQPCTESGVTHPARAAAQRTYSSIPQPHYLGSPTSATPGQSLPTCTIKVSLMITSKLTFAPSNAQPMEAPTGAHCPSSGLWSVPTEVESLRFITQGDVMPAFAGQAKTWVKVPYGKSSIS